MTASGSPTIDVVAYRVTATVEPRYVLDHKRRRSSAARQPRRALGALVEVGVLLLVVWLIPFVILAISSPIALTLRAILAMIHKL